MDILEPREQTRTRGIALIIAEIESETRGLSRMVRAPEPVTLPDQLVGIYI